MEDVQIFGVASIWRGTSDLKALAGFRIETILYYEWEQLHDSKLWRFFTGLLPELGAASSSDE